MNTKDNAQYRRTHQAIIDAVLELAAAKPLEKLRVREVCEKAGIHRSTFYLHFEDVYAVLDQTAEELSHQIMRLYANEIGDADWFRIFSSAELQAPFVRHIYDNRAFYKVYLSANGEARLARSTELLWQHVILPTYSEHGVPKNLGEYYFDFYGAGVTAVLRRWLAADCPETPEELSRILVGLMPQNSTSRPADERESSKATPSERA